MGKTSFFLTALSAVTLSVNAMADDAAIHKNLKKLGAKQIEIKPSPIKGLKAVNTEEGMLYVSEDGKYVLQGKLFELTDKGPVDVTAKSLMGTLESYKSSMIVYPAKQEKHVVTVFFDTSCVYCRKMHEQIKEYNDLGITVRYLAFPRGGMDENAHRMEAVFTAPDKIQAFNDAENGNFPKQLKMPDVVKKHYELGVKMGVRGTPSIVTASGELIGGYLPPAQLLAALKE
ncbi:bifunctional protein-disulfide isomerase/oxidoreductase DsbC [Bisgaard Taxon 10/6]|uniref:Thiol:disulfide interchange protein n=1 Tax=Exercitatus varius TaxID=67857 RepID=A0AAW6QDM8_9PAST|nr:bifunctional protein-disulfide isomerase/oxidoreductase DsbC [Exercitatus varius]MDG2916743.1 bifunctional protein-disulfide isomerase/oxidoreductase DsbC [Exercitatus varius]MDG2941392.1 bifunctional protein-disulfide isomerase/oxidoreductase DsbC [Exercitatus varius]MDG2950487.1 bifunctional protein-disulfide isomerase/oxidoreductase DsbC [Exercitatus varius]MDG2951270.1 bifunctional protein-disulfide isomerase/oxidoreductase DsbC [Exercitatus varius]